MGSRTYYQVLGVSRYESGRGIRRAFCDRARQYHPDRAGPEGTPKFHEAVQAYEILSDPEQREAYDSQVWPPRARGSAHGGAHASHCSKEAPQNKRSTWAPIQPVGRCCGSSTYQEYAFVAAPCPTGASTPDRIAYFAEPPKPKPEPLVPEPLVPEQLTPQPLSLMHDFVAHRPTVDDIFDRSLGIQNLYLRILVRVGRNTG